MSIVPRSIALAAAALTVAGVAGMGGTAAAQAPTAPAAPHTLPRIVSAAPQRGQPKQDASGTRPERRSTLPRILANAPARGHRSRGRNFALFGFSPFFYPVILGDETPEAQPAEPSGSKVIEVGPGPAGEIVEIQRLGTARIRLTRPASGSSVAAVRLFLADSLRNVLVQQTLREAPYSAVFDVSPRAWFVGASVTYTNGASTTTLLPYMPSR